MAGKLRNLAQRGLQRIRSFSFKASTMQDNRIPEELKEEKVSRVQGVGKIERESPSKVRFKQD